MKTLIVLLLLCVSYGYSSPVTLPTEPTKEKSEKKKKKEAKKNASETKNFHSIKKWKITIEYSNGNIISKTIIVKDDSKYSPLETAFREAEKHLKELKEVKGYSVTPVSSNSFVLLAGD